MRDPARILVVDDVADNVEILRMRLSSLGFGLKLAWRIRAQFIPIQQRLTNGDARDRHILHPEARSSPFRQELPQADSAWRVA